MTGPEPIGDVRLDPVDAAVDAIAARAARCVVVDDEDRENEGDLIFAAAQADAGAGSAS